MPKTILLVWAGVFTIDIPFDDFIAEAKEITEILEEFLLNYESDSSVLNEENMKKIKRELHTLKGSASIYGFMEISDLAHRFEDLLGSERNFTNIDVDYLLKIVDFINENAVSGKELSEDAVSRYQEMANYLTIRSS